ncbi:MAG: 50S ribosomal protein L6 [Porticoccaceae bacterium]|nr:50S ribosomal protein L6 [Porticoccaceae bacterium]
MSRVAKNPIQLPSGVQVTMSGSEIEVKGDRGTLSLVINAHVEVSEDGGVLSFAPSGTSTFANAMSGTTRALVNNMVIGVSNGFQKKLELVGVGYRAQVQGGSINLTLGFSHPVVYELPDGVAAETPSQTEVLLTSSDKQKLGQAAAEIRAFRPPEPYKGKGVRIQGERIRRKEAKKK